MIFDNMKKKPTAGERMGRPGLRRLIVLLFLGIASMFIVCTLHLNCAPRPALFQVTCLDTETFDHSVYRVRSTTGSSYIVLSKDVAMPHDGDTSTRLVSIQVGQQYYLTLHHFYSKPNLVVMLGGKLSMIEASYICGEGYDVQKGIYDEVLFWEHGRIVRPVYWAEQIRGTLVEENASRTGP